MAIAYKGYSAVYPTTSGNATMSLSTPQDGVAPAIGDYCVVFYHHTSPAGSSIDRGSLISSGYNSLTSNMYQDGSYAGINSRIFTKFFASAETSLVVPMVSASPERAAAWAIWFSGVDPGSPLDVASTITSGTGSKADPPAITPVTAGTVLLAFAGGAVKDNITPPTWPSPFGWDRSNSLAPTGRNLPSGIGRATWPGGTVNVTCNGGNMNSWIAGTLALREAGLVTGKPKVWTGSGFVAKPVKVWNGSAWVTKPLKVWNGSAWVFPKET